MERSQSTRAHTDRSPAGVLVTGATSMLGYPLATWLARQGHKVKAVFRSDNESVGRLREVPGLSLVRIDLSDAQSILSADIGDCRTIVHLAATSPRPELGFADLVRDNITATMNLVQFALARDVRRFVFASSMSVYG